MGRRVLFLGPRCRFNQRQVRKQYEVDPSRFPGVYGSGVSAVYIGRREYYSEEYGSGEMAGGERCYVQRD